MGESSKPYVVVGLCFDSVEALLKKEWVEPIDVYTYKVTAKGRKDFFDLLDKSEKSEQIVSNSAASSVIGKFGIKKRPSCNNALVAKQVKAAVSKAEGESIVGSSPTGRTKN